MATRTINRQDWSGRKGTYRYTKDIVDIGNDYVFKLVKKKIAGETYISVRSKGHGWKEVFKLMKHKGEWYSVGTYVEREAKKPHDVVAMIAWNEF